MAIENESIVLYRIFQGNKLDDHEFIPYNRLYPDNQRFQQLCEAFAVSFFLSYDHALRKYQEILQKNQKIGNFIAKLKLAPGIGKLTLNFHSGHCNFWYYEHVKIDSAVKLLEITPL
ncbi:MAG: hypothetical protein BWK78_08020 [Thiotrichaceae bacterium IS1]|nr:MAG: hypothetical protein BWK78_08020 [Thiotrichaceae bacterium IS1]